MFSGKKNPDNIIKNSNDLFCIVKMAPLDIEGKKIDAFSFDLSLLLHMSGNLYLCVPFLFGYRGRINSIGTYIENNTKGLFTHKYTSWPLFKWC